MSTPTGYLVVRTVWPAPVGKKGSLRYRYAGVDRVPPYPTENANEKDALEAYVFGDYKDETTNLIPSIDRAIRLEHLLSIGKHQYEIVYCCEDENAAQKVEATGIDIERLGYDVAAVRGDYWSIVADISSSKWAWPFRNCLNDHGLFSQKADAECYFREYCDRGEPDSEAPFDVIYVVRVVSTVGFEETAEDAECLSQKPGPKRN